ncbi:MAG: hypothetical protein QNJ33_04615 [Crocosphaera sp.]|nr:hypothetical protein [Crocosphaera sp.]
MQGKLLQKAPKARCYKCGTPDIKYICHDCGRPMCEQHTLFASIIHNSKTNNEISNDPLTSKRKLLTTEFMNLNLSDTECGEEPYHCAHCIHLIKGKAWKQILIGSLVVLFSFFIIPNNKIGIKFLGLLTGGGLVTYGIYATGQRKKQALNEKPPLPVLPSFEQVKIQETLKSNINLQSDGIYQAKVLSSQGQLNIEMSLKGEDFERFDKYYRKKYDSAQQFHAGFLVLKGTAGICFNQEVSQTQQALNNSSTIISLIDSIASQPLLNGSEERNGHKKNVCLTYSLQDIPDEQNLPIQLVLSFIPETDQRGLEIGIQWIKPETTENYKNNKTQLGNLKISQIELLEITFPVIWGRVENYNFGNDVVLNEDDQTIAWRKIQIQQEQERERSLTFQVQFENQINFLNIDSYIRGKVKVIFEKTLSGLEDIEFYFPTGKSNKRAVDRNRLIIQTEVEADFELSLANLRYQHTKRLPEEDKTVANRQIPLNFPGVSPTHKTIMLLTDVMSSQDQGFYVKKIIENESKRDPVAQIINRSWTIEGRWYEGVYPIDFQIDLSGHEETERNPKKFNRVTDVKLNVTGTYSNQEMEQKIASVWEQLKALIKETLEQLSPQEDEDEYGEVMRYLPAFSEEYSLEDSSIPMEAFFEEKEKNEEDFWS